MRIGDTIQAEALFQKLGDGKSSGTSFGFVWFYLHSGETEKALDWIEKAIEQHEILGFSYFFNRSILLASPRWPVIRKKLNLPETSAL